jgi:uncharacterized protein (TIGR02300 family)
MAREPPFSAPAQPEDALAKPELGQKQVCPNDQTKFYDLGRRPAVCPKCGYSFDPEELLKTRKVRVRAADYEEAEEKEDKADADTDAEELEEADQTPEIDEAVEAEPIEADDEDVDAAAPPAGPADVGVDFVEDEELTEEADDAVPFIEDDDEEFPEDDILPEEGEEEER